MGTRSDKIGALIAECLFGAKNKFAVGKLNDAAQSLTLSHQPVMFGVPTAARVVTLPTVTAADDGAWFLIINKSAGANDLTINNAAASTIGTVSQDEGGLAIVVNGAWTVVLVGTST